MRFASTDRVAAAWLSGLTGITPAMVGDTPPEDITTWSATGFITPNTVGGSSSIYLPVVSPVLSLSCWAVAPDTGVPPWWLAKNLAETVRDACRTRQNVGVRLTLPSCDQFARVLSANFTSEPRKSYADAGDWACVVVDMALNWITA